MLAVIIWWRPVGICILGAWPARTVQQQLRGRPAVAAEAVGRAEGAQERREVARELQGAFDRERDHRGRHLQRDLKTAACTKQNGCKYSCVRGRQVEV